MFGDFDHRKQTLVPVRKPVRLLANLLANLEQQIGYIQDKCIHFTVGFPWSVASVAAICGTMTQKLCHDSRMCSNIAASAGEGFMTTPK